MPSPLLSIVIPAFNEEQGIGACIDAMRQHLERLHLSWEIVVADDGSTDGTARAVQERIAHDGRVRLVQGAHGGKGAAVRRGLLAARGAWRFMADADLSMPPDNLDRLIAAAAAEPVPHIVIASREAAGARRIGEPWRRHLIGRTFNLIVRLFVMRGIRDTQCGYKLLSAPAVDAVVPHLTLDGFAFDAELLYLARRAGCDIREIGITWICRTQSRVSLAKGAAAFRDLLRIRWNAWTGRYDTVGGDAAAHRPPALRDASC